MAETEVVACPPIAGNAKPTSSPSSKISTMFPSSSKVSLVLDIPFSASCNREILPVWLLFPGTELGSSPSSKPAKFPLPSGVSAEPRSSMGTSAAGWEDRKEGIENNVDWDNSGTSNCERSKLSAKSATKESPASATINCSGLWLSASASLLETRLTWPDQL